MKAIIADKYGPPENLRIDELPLPEPGKEQVLVQVKAVAINDWDWAMIRGRPLAYRLLFGLLKPKKAVPGIELAGVVTKVGENVTRFKTGDEVFGDISGHGPGAFAGFSCCHESSLTIKPRNMSFEEAAALPHAGLLAWQGLLKGKIKHGQKILINGAGGGVGVYAIQIAREFDVQVTGVDHHTKLDLLESLGYDRVIDYETIDFTAEGILYDLILDAKTNRPPQNYTRALKPGGSYVTVGGELSKLIALMFYSLFSKKSLGILALKPNEHLQEIIRLYGEGKLQCILDGPHPFQDIPRLTGYFGEGKHRGKIVVKVED